MNIQSFLEHHGIVRNPFAEEDAQTDQVFKEHCISSAYHPIWDRFMVIQKSHRPPSSLAPRVLERRRCVCRLNGI